MKSSLSIILICIGILLSCSDFKNPFENLSNSTMVVLKDGTSISFDKVDTASIFTTETLTLAPAVRELMDSFTVTVSGNRFWLDTTVIHPQSSKYRFLISFFDTGLQNITVTTSRVNGEPHLDYANDIYVKNPLSQKDIPRTNLDNVVSLSTRPVGDQGVTYNWQFGSNGEVVVSTTPKASKQISNANTEEGRGVLWVSDSSNHSSPRVPFKFEFFDNTLPTIKCQNDNIDTTSNEVSTSDTIFKLRVTVTDRGSQPVKSVLFNREPPDIDGDNTYSKSFKVDTNNTKDNPLTVVVEAVDNIQFANHAADTFFIVFNPKAKRELHSQLGFTEAGKTISTSLRNYTVRGSVVSSSNYKIFVNAELDGKPLGDTTFPEGDGHWSWKLQLPNDTNLFTVTAVDTAGTELDKDTLFIVYNENSIDSVNPTIEFIKADNRQIDLENPVFYSEYDSVNLTIAASDKESGVVSFTINNVLNTIEKSDYYEFNKTIALSGSRDGMINIEVRDSSGNKTEYSVAIVLNNPPYQTGTLSIPYAVETGSLYIDTIRTKDVEGNQVRVKFQHKPPQMKIDSLGVISWKPLESDTGKDSLEFQLYDGISFSETYKYYFAVINPTVIKPVKFSDDSLFPRFVQVRDTLKAVLKVENGTGQAPLKFTVNRIGQKNLILNHSTDNTFMWIPQQADTGTAMFRAIVEDNLFRSDTLFQSILVVRRNSDPCSLSYRLPPGFKMTKDGSLDMRTAFSTARINIKINDDDDPLTEHHVVSFTNCHMVSTSNSDSFFIEINPSTTKTVDTVAVVVSDKTGTTDSLIIPIVYIIKSPFEISDLVSVQDESTVKYDNNNLVESWENVLNSGLFSFKSTQNHSNYVENGVNGYGYIKFNGNSDYLSISQNQSWINQPFTIFIVARKDNNSDNFMPLFTTSSNSFFSFGFSNNNVIGISNNGSETPSRLNIATSSWNILTFSSAGIENNANVNYFFQLNGLIDSLHIVSPDVGSSSIIGATGKESSSDPTFKGSIAEILIFNRQLYDQEITSVERFLGNKFGLPVNMTR